MSVEGEQMELEAQYALLWSEWLALSPLAVSDLQQFDELEREVADLVEKGEWESGPADLLSVLGRHGDELFHSSLIAWLVRPAARHRLGRQFVVRLFDRLWPGEALAATSPVTADTEVTNSGPGDDGQTQLASRADVVIRADNLVVVTTTSQRMRDMTNAEAQPRVKLLANPYRLRIPRKPISQSLVFDHPVGGRSGGRLEGSGLIYLLVRERTSLDKGR